MLITHNGGAHATLFSLKAGSTPIKLGGTDGATINNNGSTFGEFLLNVDQAIYPFYSVFVFGGDKNISFS